MYLQIVMTVLVIEVEVCEDDEIEFLDEEVGYGSMKDTPHSPLVTWLVYLIAVLQRKHYISNTAVAVLLKILSLFFTVLSRMHPQLSDIASLYSLRFFLKSDTPSCTRLLFVQNVLHFTVTTTVSRNVAIN